VVRYVYDAWGNHVVYGVNADNESIVDAQGKLKDISKDSTFSTHIGNLNPFRYRSYYYDPQTGLYYLKARYYDPEVGRFVSPDSIDNMMLQSHDINGLNLYAYCLNNPIRYSDPSGGFVLTAMLIGLIAGAVIGATVGGVTFYQEAKSMGLSGWDLFGATALGVFGGAVVGGVIGAGIGALVGIAIPAISAAASAIGTFMGTSFTLGSFAFAGEMVAVSVTGAQIVGATALLGGLVFFAKRTGKESSSDKPSWANGDMVDPNKSAQQNARDMLNNKYGPGKWGTGAGTEYSKLVKWIIRKIFFKG
jgi:RHS repeat-associated protein